MDLLRDEGPPPRSHHLYVLSSFLSSQQTKEKVKLLIQLADNLVEKGHAHVSELKRWVSTVDRRYRDFSLRVAKYQESLEKSLGISSEVSLHLLTSGFKLSNVAARLV